MSILLKVTNFIDSIVVKLLEGINYVNHLFNEVKNMLFNILAITNKNIEQFQTDNPEGFIILASICVIFCLYVLFFLEAYKIREDEKYSEM